MDYSKAMKSAAAEGLRVEDLVKQHFEAAEQVDARTPPSRSTTRSGFWVCVDAPCPYRLCSCPC